MVVALAAKGQLGAADGACNDSLLLVPREQEDAAVGEETVAVCEQLSYPRLTLRSGMTFVTRYLVRRN